MSTELQDAVQHLRVGNLVAMPTETVYGLAANACDDAAVAKIFALKGRPSFNPLIVHVENAAHAARLTRWNVLAEKLSTLWPAPLTLVLTRAENCPVSLLCSAGMETLAVRVPSHPLALALLQESGLLLAAPSANRSGRISPTTAQHVREEFGVDAPFILEGGACAVGVESTIVDVRGDVPVILRPGAITLEDIFRITGLPPKIYSGSETIAPGMLESHYAPRARVRLNATQVNAGEALLAFGKALLGAVHTLNLSEKGDVVEAAANLFAHLRALDALNPIVIAVMPIPTEGLGMAINDRLARAASPR